MNCAVKQYRWIIPDNTGWQRELGFTFGRQFDTVTVMGALMPATPPV